MDALPLDEGREAVLELARGARFVLLGEATHGTHEFYAERAELTKRLVAEHGFGAVAVEADWPNAYRVNRYFRAATRDADAREALGDFRCFPRWMWRNSVLVELAEWLRGRNDTLPRPTLPEGRRLERAIGVIYAPRTERQSHYFEADLAAQFDAVIHSDETRALEPLERTQAWIAGDVPETYPTGV